MNKGTLEQYAAHTDPYESIRPSYEKCSFSVPIWSPNGHRMMGHIPNMFGNTFPARMAGVWIRIGAYGCVSF